jgi:putative holliday junction resolvase
MSDGFVLAFDFGLRHIGVASGQTVTGTASPLVTLRAEQGKPDWHAIAELVRAWRPQRLLVGLPLNMDDSDSEMAGRARAFAAKLQHRTGIRVTLVDERLTSREAREQVRPARANRSRPQTASHQRAAVLIAETWLREGVGDDVGS